MSSASPRRYRCACASMTPSGSPKPPCSNLAALRQSWNLAGEDAGSEAVQALPAHKRDELRDGVVQVVTQLHPQGSE